LNVHRLAVLSAVVAHGSVTGAAAELSYTPSAVSQHMVALERETGVQLLERIGRRVRPTPAGEMLAKYAAEILDRVAEAEAALAGLAAGRSGRIRVASFGSASTGLVPPAVARFRTSHPQVELQLALAEQPDALFALRSNRADLAVLLLDLTTDGVAQKSVPLDRTLQWRHLFCDPYFVVLPCEHPLTALPEISLSQLAQERLISGDQSRGCPCSETFKQVCAAAGFRPTYAIEVNDFPTVQSLVAARMGIAVVPQLGLSPAVHEGVTIRRLVQPELARRIFAVFPAGRAGDPLIGAMLESLHDAADQVINQPLPQLASGSSATRAAAA
jgi:DNA-binding transcriptional LysR family regulator